MNYKEYYINQVNRRKKEYQLIKKLYLYLAKKYGNKHFAKLYSFTVSDIDSTCTYIEKRIINFNPLQIKKLSKTGQFYNYYSKRANILYPYKYRKALYIIAILHEIYHAKQRLYNKEFIKTEELQADRFAIDRVKLELQKVS